MVDHSERAAALYRENYNCAQSVLSAFHEETGMDEDQCKRIASSFGSGMGSLKDVCGALTGAFMVLGSVRGYTIPDPKTKAAYVALVDEMAAEFHERFGAVLCRDLLQRNIDDGSAEREAKPCMKYVLAAAEMVEKRLS